MSREWRSGDVVPGWDDREAPDPNAGPAPQPYVCTECDWTGRGHKAYQHWRETRHSIRGKHWPPAWGVAVFSDGRSAR